MSRLARFSLLCASALAAGSAGAIPLDHGVSTAVSIGGPNQQGAARAYNFQQNYNVPGSTFGPPGDGNGNSDTSVPGDTGVYTCSTFGCATPGYVVTSSGTSDHTGHALSAATSLSGTTAQSWSAYGTGAASLPTGTLHVTAGGTYDYTYGGEDYGSTGSGSAALFDQLTFNVAGASPTTTTDVTFTLHIDGAWSANRFSPVGSQYGQMDYVLDLGGTSFSQEAMWSPKQPYDPSNMPPINGPVPIYKINQYQTDYLENAGGGDLQLIGYHFVADDPTNTTVQLTYQLTGGSVTAAVYDGLLAYAGDGVDVNYADTSALSVSLPAGVTLSSESGSFLASGAPEPAGWALMLCGIGAMGAGPRGRRRALQA